MTGRKQLENGVNVSVSSRRPRWANPSRALWSLWIGEGASAGVSTTEGAGERGRRSAYGTERRGLVCGRRQRTEDECRDTTDITFSRWNNIRNYPIAWTTFSSSDRTRSEKGSSELSLIPTRNYFYAHIRSGSKFWVHHHHKAHYGCVSYHTLCTIHYIIVSSSELCLKTLMSSFD